MKARNLNQEKGNLFKKDIWEASELGLKPSSTHSAYRLNFSKIYPLWFRDIVKKFISFQAGIKAYYTCCSYISGLRHFGNFLVKRYPDLHAEKINRAIIIEYFAYLRTTKLGDVAKQMALIHLRTFIEIVAQEEWLPFSKERLIHRSDIPKLPSSIPKFIPETVMSQLKQHLPSLPGHQERLIFLLQETGRRISEICTLPFDCLKKDDEGSYFLEVTEHKTKKAYLIPVTDECANVIKNQQSYLLENQKANLGYLFLSNYKHATTQHAAARHIHNILNKLAYDKEIRDTTGKIWHFHSHQFRHTVGTRMINAGVSQPIVQRYLGHESPEMTSRYAYIHDRTLKEAFYKFQGKLVDVHGTLIDINSKNIESQWLKRNIMSQALPNGYCGLPAKQGNCPHANACLTCTHFRTDESFLPCHERQLKETTEVVNNAEKHGWKRQVEMNQVVKINLETIIATLKGKRHEPA